MVNSAGFNVFSVAAMFKVEIMGSCHSLRRNRRNKVLLFLWWGLGEGSPSFV